MRKEQAVLRNRARYILGGGSGKSTSARNSSIRFDIRQDGRMGPTVIISVVRRSHSHLKKKRRYESVQLQEYRGIRQNRPARQMVSVDLRQLIFFSIFAPAKQDARVIRAGASRAALAR